MQKSGLFSITDITVLFTGGLALFLYGIRIMSSGLKKASGERVRQFIAKITGNRVYGLLAGAFATLIVQSSSTIIATLVGLVQSRLMTYSQALAVVLGAEIGTTAMAQLFAFSLQDYALIVFAAGFALNVFGKSESLRFSGEALSGFGLLFFGLRLMSEAMAPLQQQPSFISFLHYIEHPLLGVATGIAVTALMHSSAAFIGIIITLALQGSMSLETGIALLLGANIGTCITAVCKCWDAARSQTGSTGSGTVQCKRSAHFSPIHFSIFRAYPVHFIFNRSFRARKARPYSAKTDSQCPYLL